MDLFVRLHGMLFTKIDLDNFSTVMSRFMERLEEDARLDGVSRKATVTQVDWIVMATVNIAAVLQYGSVTGVLRKALSVEGQERRRAQAINGDDDGEDGDNVDIAESGPAEEETSPMSDHSAEVNPTFLNALHLTFTMLEFALEHPTRQQGLHAVLNPYITLVLTFLSTMCRQPHVASILVDHMPWKGLVDFLTKTGLEVRDETRLMAGPPLPEDWAVRGMEWVGRRVYERGFWKAKTPGRGSGAMAQPTPRSGERFQSEMDVLLANFETSLDISEGVIDEADGTDLTDGPVAVNQRRWKRIIWAAGVMLKYIDGFDLVDGGLAVQGALKMRLEENERAKKAEEEQDRRRELVRREKERAEELADLEALLEAGDDDVDLRDLKVGATSSSTPNPADDRFVEISSGLAADPDPSCLAKPARRSKLPSVPFQATRCSCLTRMSSYPRSTSSALSWKVANGASSSPFPLSRSWTVCPRTRRHSACPRLKRYRTSSPGSGRTRFASKSRRRAATIYRTCSFARSTSISRTRSLRAATWTTSFSTSPVSRTSTSRTGQRFSGKEVLSWGLPKWCSSRLTGTCDSERGQGVSRRSMRRSSRECWRAERCALLGRCTSLLRPYIFCR